MKKTAPQQPTPQQQRVDGARAVPFGNHTPPVPRLGGRERKETREQEERSGREQSAGWQALMAFCGLSWPEFYGKFFEAEKETLLNAWRAGDVKQLSSMLQRPYHGARFLAWLLATGEADVVSMVEDWLAAVLANPAEQGQREKRGRKIVSPWSRQPGNRGEATVSTLGARLLSAYQANTKIYDRATAYKQTVQSFAEDARMRDPIRKVEALKAFTEGLLASEPDLEPVIRRMVPALLRAWNPER